MSRPEERDFAGFRIVRPLSLGERASVWEAEDPETGRLVAIETLAGDAAGDEDVREWFTEAWELVSELKSPGIVTVVGVGVQEGVPFVVRRPSGETTLAARIEGGGPIPALTAAALIEATGEALQSAHEAGVIHGELDPTCVVLAEPEEHDPEGTGVLLAGFGRAEGDRREDIRDLGAILEAVLPDAAEAEALSAAPDSDGDTDLEEARRVQALSEVASAAAADGFASAQQLVEAARLAVAEPDLTGGAGDGRPRRMLIAAISILVVALVVILLVSGGDDDKGSSQTSPQGTSTEADTGSTTETTDSTETTTPGPGPAGPVAVRGFPVGVSARDGVVYTVTKDGQSLDGFSEGTGDRVLGPVDVGGAAEDVTVVNGVAWVSLGDEGALAWVDLSTEDPTATSIAAGDDPGPLIGARGSIWVVDQGGKQLLEFPQDLSENTEPEATDLKIDAPAGIAFGAGALWISDASGNVVRVDPKDPSDQQSFQVGGQPGGLLVLDDQVWVADEADGNVIRLDPSTGKTRSISLGGEPKDVAADPSHLWVLNADGYATSVDLESGATEQVDLSGAGGSPQAIAVGQQVWVTTGSGNTLVAIAPASS